MRLAITASILSLTLTALALTVPTFAAAQTVTTDCYSHKRSVHCYSSVRPSISDTIDALANASRDRSYRKVIQEGERLLKEQGRPKFDPRDHAPEFQKWQITQLLVVQDCLGAQRYSMASGNAEQIERVEASCGKVQDPQQIEALWQQRQLRQLQAERQQYAALAAQPDVVPKGVLLNSATILDDGTKRCRFSNGFERVIPIQADCFKR